MVGGAVVTVTMLVACILQIWATVNSYAITSKEDMWSAAQRSERAMLRITSAVYEVVGVWAAQAEYLPEDTERLQTRLADTAGDMLKSLSRSVYILDADLNPLAVSHVAGTRLSASDIALQQLAGDSSAFQNVIRPYFRHSLSRGANGQGNMLLQWLPPHTSSVTGQRVVSVMGVVEGFDRSILGAVVIELPLVALSSLLSWDKNYGGYVLMASSGELLLSSSIDDLSTVEGIAREVFKRDKIGSRFYSQYTDGYLVTATTLAPTPWGLFYFMPRKGIISGVAAPAMMSIATTTVIIGGAWALLLFVRRRISAPIILQSQLISDSEELNRVLVEAAPVGFGIISLNSRKPLLASAQMEEVEANGVMANGGLSAELCTRFLQNEGNTKNSCNQSYSFELTLSTRSGMPIFLSVMIVKVRYKSEDALVVMFTDITSFKQTERALKEARAMADSANAAKSAFLAAMSHEIRTPLNAIQGNLELLAHSKLDPVQRDRLTVVNSASEVLVATVNDVLDFSKIEAGELHLDESVFDVNKVVVRALLMFAPIARNKGLLLTSDFGFYPSQLMRGDQTRFAQVVNNLLSNALKFTESGRVSLTIRLNAEGDELTVEVADTGIGMTAEQMSVLFCAFSQADKTIHRRFGGTGLGLALCERLVSAMGGSLTARSKFGIGSQFTLHIPINVAINNDSMPRFSNKKVLVVADAYDAGIMDTLRAWGLLPVLYSVQSPELPTQGPLASIVVLWGECQTLPFDEISKIVIDAEWVIECRADGPSVPMISGRLINASMYGLQGLLQSLEYALLKRVPPTRERSHYVLERRIRVVLVEDHPVTRQLLEEQLTLLGCDVRAVSDGHEALQLMEPNPCEVLLTDLQMPGMSGYELVKHVHDKWPWMPILILTADLTTQSVRAFADEVHTKVVGKPLSLKRLSFAISEISGVKSVRGRTGQQSAASRVKPMPDELLKIFQVSNENSIKVLRQAWQDQDVPRLLAELHAVRGALSVFGLSFLAQQGSVLSDALKTNSLEESRTNFRRFCFALQLALHPPKSGYARLDS
jgi:two-component system capsular synthesis sensor histidine kinase RcsC